MEIRATNKSDYNRPKYLAYLTTYDKEYKVESTAQNIYKKGFVGYEYYKNTQVATYSNKIDAIKGLQIYIMTEYDNNILSIKNHFKNPFKNTKVKSHDYRILYDGRDYKFFGVLSWNNKENFLHIPIDEDGDDIWYPWQKIKVGIN